MRNWESSFQSWISPPSNTEDQKIQRAIAAVRSALGKDAVLNSNSHVYVHGSYRNNVNAKLNSDIDIGVFYTGSMFGVDLPNGTTKEDFGLVDSIKSYSEFRDEVHQVLLQQFSSAEYRRDDKALKVRSNSYRVDTDVIPVMEHRSYNSDGTYISGVEFISDSGIRIINWPEKLVDNRHWIDQHYENGVSKNLATGRRYKKVVRILKQIMYEMVDNGSASATATSGFTIECMVWNVPNSLFEAATWYDTMQQVMAYLWSNTGNRESCSEWCEVSNMKFIFSAVNDTKRVAAYTFINEAWGYIGVQS